MREWDEFDVHRPDVWPLAELLTGLGEGHVGGDGGVDDRLCPLHRDYSIEKDHWQIKLLTLRWHHDFLRMF